MSEKTLAQRAQRIKLVVMDIDGVLTDARVGYDTAGNEVKFFSVRDGLGMRLMLTSGIEIALLSGRESPANQKRAQELGIKELKESVLNKVPVLEELMTARGLEPSEVAYLGDDLIDLKAMSLVGLAGCPSDAVEPVRRAAHWVADYPGGGGAARQFCHFVLLAQDKWQAATEKYFK